MKRTTLWIMMILGVILQSCVSSKSSFNPNKKYSLSQIEKDYSVFEDMLQESHPSLYWYTPKDSLDHFFRWGAEQLKDSMTEPEFRKILAYVISKIDCGHTSVRASKKYSSYQDTLRTKIFPFSMKLWGDKTSPVSDTMVIALNLNRRDSVLKRGTVIEKINGLASGLIIDSLFNFLSADGHNRTHKFQTLSNRGSFGSLYTSVFGLPDKFQVDYVDERGQVKSTIVSSYNPTTDSSFRTFIRPLVRQPRPTRREIKQMQLPAIRSLRIDSVNNTAFMDLNSFGRGFHLKKFFRESFRSLRKNKTQYLIIDVRGNGGGSVTNSTFLSRFISDHLFKVADSLYAVSRKNHYGRYMQNYFWNRLFMFFFTKKRPDNHYHFGYYERHRFHPKKNNHFNERVYILSGGNSFSATTLFISAVNKQENVTTVGEETGGGAYGNTAWLIPDVTLPNTRIRFRLPLFRLVMDKNNPKTGLGVQPKIEVDPTVDAIRRNADYKLDKVMELIRSEKARKENR